jgi:protein-S-isoprenylcysteine O-methyltransferase Ste14
MIQGVTQAVQPAVRRRYHAPAQSRLSPPAVVAGPVFALVVPVTYTIEAQPQDAGVHPPSDHHHPANASVEVLLVLVVIAIAGWTWFMGWLPKNCGPRSNGC